MVEVLGWTGPGKPGRTIYCNRRAPDKELDGKSSFFISAIGVGRGAQAGLSASTTARGGCAGIFPPSYHRKEEFFRGSRFIEIVLIVGKDSQVLTTEQKMR